METITLIDELNDILSRLEGSTGFFLQSLESAKQHKQSVFLPDLIGMAATFNTDAAKANDLIKQWIDN